MKAASLVMSIISEMCATLAPLAHFDLLIDLTFVFRGHVLLYPSTGLLL